MGMGLLGAMGGLGQAGQQVGEQMQRAADQRSLKQHEIEYLAKERERVDQIAEAKAKARRELFVSEMDGMRTAKLGENAGNLNQAAEIYRSSEGLSEEDRQAGLGAVNQARSRLGKLAPEEIGMAGLKTGNLEAKDYIAATSRSETAADKMANLMAIKMMQEQGKDGRLDKNIESRESIAGDRIDSNERVAELNRDGRGGEGKITPSQSVMNREIEAARRRVAGLDPDEIKKKTAKFTNTGRDNPDYDAGLATRVRIAAKRKYGADDWFDSQNGLDSDGVATPATPKVDDNQNRFAADPDMKGFKLGKQTAKGYEVFNSAGKLVGHYK